MFKNINCAANTHQWISGFIASMTIFTSGMQNGWMSPNILRLKSEDSPSGYALSDFDVSIIASSLSFFAFIFTLLYSFTADRYGRKIGLIAIAIPQTISWLVKLSSAHFIALLVSQCLAGIAGGGVYLIVPIYTKEISKGSISGAVCSIGMLLQSTGYLLMYVIGGYLEYYTVLWISVWIPLLNLLFLIRAPESPAYLLKKGRDEDAAESLAYLFGLAKDDQKVISEIQAIKHEQQQTQDVLPCVTVKDIFAIQTTRRAFFVAITLIIVLEFGGNFAIATYASFIVKESGATINPNVQAMSFPAVMIIGAVISLAIVDKVGRKPLFLTCVVFNALPMSILATYLLIKEIGIDVSLWVPIVSIVMCVFAYGAGILPIPFIVIAEIFSVQVRIKITGFLVTLGWFLSFLQVVAFTPVSRYLGMYTMFYLFSFINLVGGILSLISMPETKGKSLEQIEKLLNKNRK